MVRLAARLIVLIAALIVLPGRLFAAPIVIDFDTLGDLGSVTSQFAGLTFSNATVLTAGSSLNEFEFPPRSGSNVLFDDGGAISIDFTTPIFGFGGFFTYLTPLTITAFDSSHNLLGSVSSQFATNLAVSGDAGTSPNEFLQFWSTVAIGSVSVAGDPAGGSFVVDDVTLQTAPVPEPGTLSLLAVGALLAVRARRRGRSRG
jgi:hypothetical protein